FGLWTQSFAADLLWKAGGTSNLLKTVHPPPPSWSWVSVKGPIFYDEQNETFQACKFHNLNPSDPTYCGKTGRLLLSGYVASATLTAYKTLAHNTYEVSLSKANKEEIWGARIGCVVSDVDSKHTRASFPSALWGQWIDSAERYSH